MRRPRVLVDVDGVLADFTGAWLEIMVEMTGLEIKREEVSDWDIFGVLETRGVNEPLRNHVKEVCRSATSRAGFCGSLKVLAGAQDGFNQLRDIADVYIVTSPWNSPYWTFERDSWLLDNFGVPRKNIVHTDAKYLVSGDYLIDDKTSHIVNWCAEQPNGQGILWESAHNKGHEIPENSVTLSDWHSVFRFIQEG